ncbi:hypothetical protein E4U22_002435, partial [Claviceps purpurea]
VVAFRYSQPVWRKREKTPSPLRRGPATSKTAGKSKQVRSLRNRKPEDQKQGSLRRPSPLRRGPATSTTAGKSKHARSLRNRSPEDRKQGSLRNLNKFFFDNSIHFPADHITPEATESSYFDTDDHDNTSRPSMLMAYGICTLENHFNSYYSTAMLQSGGYSTKTAISTSKTNSIATF